jgi:hypothetical protein
VDPDQKTKSTFWPDPVLNKNIMLWSLNFDVLQNEFSLFKYKYT